MDSIYPYFIIEALASTYDDDVQGLLSYLESYKQWAHQFCAGQNAKDSCQVQHDESSPVRRGIDKLCLAKLKEVDSER